LQARFAGSKLAAVDKQPLLGDKQQASKLEAEFAEILEPFEVDAGASLKGWGRQKCFAAFAAHPSGFQVCMSEALERGRNPIALLVQMVKDDDPRDRERSGSNGSTPEPPPPPAPRGFGVCANCGREAVDALYIRGEWWCPKHEGLAAA
jgi:hypothetical protein